MPGVLIETGYLTNSRDERFLNTEDGQVYIASAIYRAFKEYKRALESRSTPLQSSEQKSSPVVEKKDEVVYRVQFAVSKKKKDPSRFKEVDNVSEYFHNGMYKYAAGNESNLRDATNLQNRIRKNRQYKDAFVIAFVNGERVSVSEAESVLGNR
jgi:N-acetylmuramoyl-L-alanine amidase